MNESEWLACADPDSLLEFLQEKATERQLRLFACACCRRIWRVMPSECSRRAVEVSEGFADGKAGREELSAARRAILNGGGWREAIAVIVAAAPRLRAGGFVPGDPERVAEATWRAADRAADKAPKPTSENEQRQRTWRTIFSEERTAQATLLRDICGNCFRPLTLDPSWLTPTVLALAQTAYEERELPSGHLDPVRLAVLADALEDAGCTAAELLDHLRGPGPHFRGCWATDLVLGRS